MHGRRNGPTPCALGTLRRKDSPGASALQVDPNRPLLVENLPKSEALLKSTETITETSSFEQARIVFKDSCGFSGNPLDFNQKVKVERPNPIAVKHAHGMTIGWKNTLTQDTICPTKWEKLPMVMWGPGILINPQVCLDGGFLHARIRQKGGSKGNQKERTGRCAARWGLPKLLDPRLCGFKGTPRGKPFWG